MSAKFVWNAGVIVAAVAFMNSQYAGHTVTWGQFIAYAAFGLLVLK